MTFYQNNLQYHYYFDNKGIKSKIAGTKLLKMKKILIISIFLFFHSSRITAQSQYINFKYYTLTLIEECRYCHEKHSQKFLIAGACLKFNNESDKKYEIPVSMEVSKKTGIPLKTITNTNYFSESNYYSEMSPKCDNINFVKHGIETTAIVDSVNFKLLRSDIVKIQTLIDEKAEKERMEMEKDEQLKSMIFLATDSIKYGFSLSEKGDSTCLPIIERSISTLEKFGQIAGQKYIDFGFYKKLVLAKLNLGQFTEALDYMSKLETYYRNNNEYSSLSQLLEVQGWAYILNGSHSLGSLSLIDAKKQAGWANTNPCGLSNNLLDQMKYYREQFPDNKSIKFLKILPISTLLTNGCL